MSHAWQQVIELTVKLDEPAKAAASAAISTKPSCTGFVGSKSPCLTYMSTDMTCPLYNNVTLYSSYNGVSASISAKNASQLIPSSVDPDISPPGHCTVWLRIRHPPIIPPGSIPFTGSLPANV